MASGPSDQKLAAAIHAALNDALTSIGGSSIEAVQVVRAPSRLADLDTSDAAIWPLETNAGDSGIVYLGQFTSFAQLIHGDQVTSIHLQLWTGIVKTLLSVINDEMKHTDFRRFPLRLSTEPFAYAPPGEWEGIHIGLGAQTPAEILVVLPQSGCSREAPHSELRSEETESGQ